MAELLEMQDALRSYPYVLLDTCVLIDEFNRPTGVIRRIRRAQRRTSIIALWEFLRGTAGAVLGREDSRRRQSWLDDQGIVPLDLSRGFDLTFRALLSLGDAPPHLPDCLLAAQCLARNCPLFTRNVRDFDGIPRLRIVTA
ncbi:MAG TPA: type II toxin-antitoxin system VapC family toxin [Polyangia bacterium]|jgi:predicted nucleic acid-binding protein